MPATETPEARAISAELRGLIESLGYVPRVSVKSEPLTYENNPDCKRSYIRDLALAAKDQPDREAVSRLSRHESEMRVENAKFETRGAPSDVSFEHRVAPNTTDGTGGYFTVPLWMNQYFATGRRTSRVLSAQVPNFSLPVGVHSINMPRLTTGNAVEDQQDGTAVADQDGLDAQTNATVCTLAGQGDVALQLLEQSPPGAHLDWAFFKDLTESYDQQLEIQMVNGTGIGETFLGLINVIGNNKITFTSAAVSSSVLYPFLGQAAAQIGDNRDQPPEAWLMTTSRWAWIGTGLDNAGRPIVTPDVHPPRDGVDGVAREALVSDLLGWPVFCNDAIPTNLGAAMNQDTIIACKPLDLMLFEGVPKTAVFLEVLSGTLQARIQFHNYAAFVSGRYPAGISYITGSGMVVQQGF